jgi:acyl-CoA thioester hydrolase
MRNFNFPYKKIEDMGIMLPVKSLDVKYYQAAKYDDLLTVKTTIKEMPTAKITFHYEIVNEEGVLLNEGNTTLVFVDETTRRPRKAPKEILDQLKPYFKF